MKPEVIRQVISELQARGFTSDLMAPNGSLAFSERYLEGETLAGLFDLVLSRREKMFRTIPELGLERTRAAYADAVIAVEAVGAVISGLADDISK